MNLRNGNIRSSKIAQVYAYFVSFAALLVFAVVTIFGIVGVVKVVAPKYTLSKYEYQSMERSALAIDDTLEVGETREIAPLPSDTLFVDSSQQVELKKAAPLARGGVVNVVTPESILERQRHEGISELIHMFAAWIVCIPIFWLHFRWGGRLAAKEARTVRSSNQRYPRRRPTKQHPPKSG